MAFADIASCYAPRRILSLCVQAGCAVSRAQAVNADFCQVERSHRSNSIVGLSPRRALLVRSSAGHEPAACEVSQDHSAKQPH